MVVITRMILPTVSFFPCLYFKARLETRNGNKMILQTVRISKRTPNKKGLIFCENV